MKPTLFSVYVFLIFLNASAFGQSSNIIIPSSVTPNTPNNLGVDSYTRATTSIKLQPGFKYGFVTGGASNLLNLNISSYPSGVNNNYVNPGASNSQDIKNPSLPMGVTAGNAVVSNVGAFNYNIPILCSPGTSGIQPNLAIYYDSNFPNSILGQGFTLSGISCISRCNKTPYYDGLASNINFHFIQGLQTPVDALMLDGERLLELTGTYGQNNATYKTEVNNFCNITSYGSNSSGPDYFIVQTSDGKTIEYGNSSDSKFFPMNSSQNWVTPIAWYVNKVVDQFGNCMNFSYTTNDGDILIDHIDYTSNINAGLSAFNTIKFSYVEKSDTRRYSSSNGATKATKLLKSITCQSLAGTLYRRYTFEYSFSNVSRLHSITETDSEGNDLNPTYFDWTKFEKYTNTSSPFYPSNGVTPSGLGWNGIDGNVILSISADMTGDGRDDLVTVKNDNPNNDVYIDIYKTVTSGYNGGARTDFVKESTTIFPNNILFSSAANRTIIDAYVFDENDDNKMEVYVSYVVGLVGNTLQYEIRKISYNGSVYSIATVYTGSIPPNMFLINYPLMYSINRTTTFRGIVRSGYLYAKEDINGDDVKDVIAVDQNGISVTDGSSNQSFSRPIGSSLYPSLIKTKLGDVNGDGVLDICIFSTKPLDCNNPNHFGLNNEINVQVLSVETSTLMSLKLLANEIFQVNVSKVSTQNGCSPDKINEYFERLSNNIDFGDFNGDGLIDVVFNKHVANKLDVYTMLSSVSFIGIPKKVGEITNSTSGIDPTFYAADLNSDGLCDWVQTIHDPTTSKLTTTYYPVETNNSLQNYNYLQLANSTYTYEVYSRYAGTFGDYDGDGFQDFVSQPAWNIGVGIEYNVYNSPGTPKLKKIDNIKDITIINYGYLSNEKADDGYRLYQQFTTNNPAGITIHRPKLYVVSSTEYNGNRVYYGYANGLLHRTKRGFLGFEKLVSYNQISNLAAETSFIFNVSTDLISETKHLAGIAGPTVNTFISASNNLESEVETIYNYATSSNEIYLSSITTESKDFLKSTRHQEISVFDFSANGNVLTNTRQFLKWLGNTAIRKEVTSFQYTSTTNSYNGSTIYKPVEKTVTKEATVNNVLQSSTFVTSYSYDASGHLSSRIDNSNLSGNEVTTTFQYSALHQPSQITVSAPDLSTASVTNYEYDNTGRFITKKINPLGDVVEMTYNSLSGNIVTFKNGSALTAYYFYDGLGRKVKSKGFGGAEDNTHSEWSSYYVPGSGTYYGGTTTYQIEGFGTSKKYFDRNGNILKSERDGFNGSTEIEEFTYNDLNQLIYKTEPHYASQNTYGSCSLTYDTYHRPLKVSRTINNIVTEVNFAYNQPSTSNYVKGYSRLDYPTSNTGQSFYLRKENDEAGQIDKIINYSNPGAQHVSTYKFNEFGEPIEANNVFAGTGITTTYFSYDVLGRRSGVNDPTAGSTTFQYNSIGQLTTQISPSGTYTFAYDIVGRLVDKTNTLSQHFIYQYVTTANGLGKLKKITGPDVTTEFKYDLLGRLFEKKETLTSSGNKVLKSTFTYNKYDQVVDHFYPGDFSIKNEYDGIGNLIKIKSGTTTIWELTSMLTPDKISQFSCNNGQLNNSFVYDNNLNISEINYGTMVQQSYTIEPHSGNPKNRSNSIPPNSFNNESISFDEFDRLTNVDFFDPNLNAMIPRTSVSYLPNGNINYKSDAGNYAYAQAPGSPYSLVSVSSQVNNISLNTLTINHTDFKKVSQILEASTNKQMDFMYSNSEDRIKMEYKESNVLKYTRFYAEDYDREEKPNSFREWSYIYAPTGLCAVYYNNNGLGKLHYIFTDLLGSPTALVNDQNQFIEQYSYDSWGRLRDPNDWNNYTVSSLPTHLIRGYTGHEELFEFGIVNMNSRIYDPVLGRFLETDNYIQNPDNLQNFNRFSYVLNNPLKYVDPTGQFWHVVIGAAVGGVINLGIKAYQGKIHSFTDGLVAFGIGAAAGAIGAATGGAALGYAGVAGASLAGGVISGAAGAAASSPVMGFGNQAYFGDPYSLKDFGRDVLVGAALGGAIGYGVGLYYSKFTPNGVNYNLVNGRYSTIVTMEPYTAELPSGNKYDASGNLLNSKYNSVDDLINQSTYNYEVKTGSQYSLYGEDGQAIYENLAKGGTYSGKGNAVVLKDGTVIHKHISTTDQTFTIQIDQSKIGGKIYKVRIFPK